jgi:hypothetical protein
MANTFPTARLLSTTTDQNLQCRCRWFTTYHMTCRFRLIMLGLTRQLRPHWALQFAPPFPSIPSGLQVNLHLFLFRRSGGHHRSYFATRPNRVTQHSPRVVHLVLQWQYEDLAPTSLMRRGKQLHFKRQPNAMKTTLKAVKPILAQMFLPSPSTSVLGALSQVVWGRDMSLLHIYAIQNASQKTPLTHRMM